MKEARLFVILIGLFCLLIAGCGTENKTAQEAPTKKGDFSDLGITPEEFRERFNAKLDEMVKNGIAEAASLKMGELDFGKIENKFVNIADGKVGNKNKGYHYFLEKDKTSGNLVWVWFDTYKPETMFGTKTKIEIIVESAVHAGCSKSIPVVEYKKIYDALKISEPRSSGEIQINHISCVKGEANRFAGVAEHAMTHEARKGMLLKKWGEDHKVAFMIYHADAMEEFKKLEDEEAKDNKKQNKEERARQQQSMQSQTQQANDTNRPSRIIRNPDGPPLRREFGGRQWSLISLYLCDGRYWYINYELSNARYSPLGISKDYIRNNPIPRYYFAVGGNVREDEYSSLSTLTMPSFFLELCSFYENGQSAGTENIMVAPSQEYEDYVHLYYHATGQHIRLPIEQGVNLKDNKMLMRDIVMLAVAKYVNSQNGEKILSNIPGESEATFYRR